MLEQKPLLIISSREKGRIRISQLFEQIYIEMITLSINLIEMSILW